MKLFDATLDLARATRGIERHRITSANFLMREMILITMAAFPREYSGGALWFITGASAGEATPILSAIDQRITIKTAPKKGYKNGDEVVISPWLDWTLQELENAVNNVLAHYPVMKRLELPATADGIYELPREVYDVRRVETKRSDREWQVNHYWEQSGKTVTIHNPSPYIERVRIHYAADHDAIGWGERIDDSVDGDTLRKLAILNLWRNEITTKKRDNAAAVDLYNEAKNYEAEIKRNNTLLNRLLPRDRTFAW